MLHISDLKPTLKAQTDSIRVKLFVWDHTQMYFILVPLIHIHTTLKLSFLPDNDVTNIETPTNSILLLFLWVTQFKNISQNNC